MAKFKITKRDVIDVVKKRWWVMLIELGVLAVILLADLLTKKYIVEFLFTKDGRTYPLIKGFITLAYTENTGAGFGIFQGNTVALTVVTAIVIAAILVYLILAQKENMWLRVSLLFIVGGGIGNLVDRIGLGYVRDFIQFAFWEDFAIFNVADSFVTVGVFMLIIVLIVMLVSERKKSVKEFEEEQKNKLQEHFSDPLDAPIELNPMMKSENEFTIEAVSAISQPENNEYVAIQLNVENNANSDGNGDLNADSADEKDAESAD
ncbi:MAG: signal peptidase II [Bacteroides sp.]|nr:signal peptidase II [Bacillota bacterium]MCM1393453.1 signal peptidase II [[Eubacterium] siraeum]MCM1455047.1 signal peptidase II [Bacteroides sp.]